MNVLPRTWRHSALKLCTLLCKPFLKNEELQTFEHDYQETKVKSSLWTECHVAKDFQRNISSIFVESLRAALFISTGWRTICFSRDFLHSSIQINFQLYLTLRGSALISFVGRCQFRGRPVMRGWRMCVIDTLYRIEIFHLSSQEQN